MDREPNSVVESETESGMSFFTAFTAIEKVTLDLIDDGEQLAACSVGGLLSSGTGNLADNGSVDLGRCESDGDNG